MFKARRKGVIKMATDRVVKLNMEFMEEGDATGKIVNVYDSYANALAHGATGLATVKAVDPLTGAIGNAISQTAKTAGPTVDANNKLLIALSDATNGAVYWLNSVAGRMGGPLKVVVLPESVTPAS